MTDLVVISLEVWDEVWRRNQHLVAGLVRTQRVGKVLFVEPVVDIPHDLRHRRMPQPTGLRRVELAGSEAEIWALRPRKWLPRRLRTGSDRRRAAAIARTASRLGMSSPALWVNDPGGAEVLAGSGWPAFYDITDDWLLADRPAAELARLRRQEDFLMDNCRAVVVCSRELQRSKSARRDVHLIPNAVDLSPYRFSHPRPSDLPPGKIAMYLGTAHRDRVDVALCIQTAHTLAADVNASLVLVGPAPLAPADLAALHQAGVQILGPRPSAQVPAYLQHADVLVVPHVTTEFTRSLDPIKSYEYRAARRPVVAIPLPGFDDIDDPAVRAVSPSEFPSAVASAIARPPSVSQAVPEDLPTWDQRVDQMAQVLAGLSDAASR